MNTVQLLEKTLFMTSSQKEDIVSSILIWISFILLICIYSEQERQVSYRHHQIFSGVLMENDLDDYRLLIRLSYCTVLNVKTKWKREKVEALLDSLNLIQKIYHKSVRLTTVNSTEADNILRKKIKKDEKFLIN